MSVDPAFEKYLPVAPVSDEAREYNKELAGQGGIFTTINLSLYHCSFNNPLKYQDPNGTDVILLNDSKAVANQGHNAVLVGNDKDGWTYYSKDGKQNGNGYNKKIDPKNPGDKRERTDRGNYKQDYKTLKDFQDDKAVSGRYDRQIRVRTTKEQDQKMNDFAVKNYDTKYNFLVNNCADLTAGVLNSGGIDLSFFENSTASITTPNKQYDSLDFKTSPSVSKFIKILLNFMF